MIGNTCCELWTQNRLYFRYKIMAFFYFAVSLIFNFGCYTISFANIFSLTSG